MYKLYSKMIENTSWVHHFICKILLLIFRIFTLCEWIQIYCLKLLENIYFNTFFLNKIVSWEVFVKLSMFSFVVVHNRKIPRGLTKLTYTWAGYKRINWIREVDNENDEIFSLSNSYTKKIKFSVSFMLLFKILMLLPTCRLSRQKTFFLATWR